MYLPISLRSLNRLILDNPPSAVPKESKDGRFVFGRKELISIEELAEIQMEHHKSNPGKGWEKADTAQILLNAAKQAASARGIDPDTIKTVHAKTVNKYHGALISMAGNKFVASKPQPVHREVAVISERAMLSNVALLLARRCMVLLPNEVQI